MTSFVLKLIAIISMLFDHTGYLIFKKFTFMNFLGRLSFPIFTFMLTEGFIHTKNLSKYFLRLCIFAIISQIPYIFFIKSFSNNLTLNILFTLLLGLSAITVYDKSKNKILGFLFVISCCIVAHFLHFDYGWFGISIIFTFYIFKEKKLYMNLSFILLIFINYFSLYLQTFRYEYLFIILFGCISLIPINLYNGKKGKSLKYVFYLFYPLHLIVLYLINLLFI